MLTMFLIESLWKPNFWVKSKKISSISSFESGMLRSEPQAGYASREPARPWSTKVGVEDSEIPILGGPSDSVDGMYF